MSRQAQSVPLDSWDLEKIHREKVIAKLQKIQTLKALVEMHEADPDHDHEYLVALRARLRSAENQYKSFYCDRIRAQTEIPTMLAIVLKSKRRYLDHAEGQKQAGDPTAIAQRPFHEQR